VIQSEKNKISTLNARKLHSGQTRVSGILDLPGKDLEENSVHTRRRFVNVEGQMKCIVTAGPTYEELDEVRRMTNFSTGALGSELANYLVEQGREVELLRGHYSTCCIAAKAQNVQVFTTTADLRQRLEGLGSSEVGAVFHAAAVSDYTFGKIWRRAENGELSEIKSRKISTRSGTVLAELTPTPKIIGHLRVWFPKARLVGWKYEVEGDRAQVIARAERQLADNHTDACVVNGPAYGTGYGLVEDPGRCRHLPDKTALFKALADFSGM
jgi:phosphopantothenoylcysteine synthetase/decarboxylase